MRLFNATCRELIQVQAERKGRRIEELQEAAAAHESAPSDWHPSQDGFACSIDKSARYLLKKSRQNLAHSAWKPEPAPYHLW